MSGICCTYLFELVLRSKMENDQRLMRKGKKRRGLFFKHHPEDGRRRALHHHHLHHDHQVMCQNITDILLYFRHLSRSLSEWQELLRYFVLSVYCMHQFRQSWKSEVFRKKCSSVLVHSVPGNEWWAAVLRKLIRFTDILTWWQYLIPLSQHLSQLK